MIWLCLGVGIWVLVWVPVQVQECVREGGRIRRVRVWFLVRAWVWIVTCTGAGVMLWLWFCTEIVDVFWQRRPPKMHPILAPMS